MNPVHILQSIYSNIKFNIILPSTPMPMDVVSYCQFSDKNYVWLSQLSHKCYMSCPS